VATEWRREKPPVIEADTYEGHQGGGGSDAERIRGNDGYRYIVKFRGNPQGTRILANEYVTSQIGELIGAPCPVGRVMRVSLEFIQRVPIKYGGVLAGAGPQFASRFQCDEHGATFQNPVPSVVKQFVNKDQAAAKIILDNLVANQDVKNEHIIFHAVKGGIRFWAVDFGHTLGIAQGWESLRPSSEDAPLVAPFLTECVLSRDDLNAVVDRLKARLTRETLLEVLSEVPLEAWGVAAQEVSPLIDYLLTQRECIPRRVSNSLKQFPSLIDG
jgi:hypothetical protein